MCIFQRTALERVEAYHVGHDSIKTAKWENAHGFSSAIFCSSWRFKILFVVLKKKPFEIAWKNIKWTEDVAVNETVSAYTVFYESVNYYILSSPKSEVADHQWFCK